MGRTTRINEKYRGLTEKQASSKMLRSFQASSKAISDLAKSFGNNGKRIVIGTPPSKEGNLFGFDVIPNKKLPVGRFILDESGDCLMEDCETAVFRDSPLKGTREELRNAIKSMIPISRNFDDVLEELKDNPQKGKRSMESIIAKYKIINN